MDSFKILLPSKGRPKALRRLLQACPTLNRRETFIGVDIEDAQYCGPNDEVIGEYERVIQSLAPKAITVPIRNPGGYTSVAREKLRLEALKRGGAKRYVLVDDNSVFAPDALSNLLACQAEWDNGVMAGGHPTAKHFHADQIAETTEVRGDLSSYEQVGMIFWCVPHRMYGKFEYPLDCYFDDVYFILWCMSKGFTNFRSTLDAPFNKHLHEPGGTGTVAERIRKRGVGFARLATDFPQFMTTDILSTRVPYKRILKAIRAGKESL